MTGTVMKCGHVVAGPNMQQQLDDACEAVRALYFNCEQVLADISGTVRDPRPIAELDPDVVRELMHLADASQRLRLTDHQNHFLSPVDADLQSATQ